MTVAEKLMREVKIAEFQANNNLIGLDPDFDIFITSAVFSRIYDYVIKYANSEKMGESLGHKLFGHNVNVVSTSLEEYAYWFANKRKLYEDE